MVKGRKCRQEVPGSMCRCSCEALGKTPEHVELLGDGLSRHGRAQSLLCPGADRLHSKKTMTVIPQSFSGGPEIQQGHCMKNTLKKTFEIAITSDSPECRDDSSLSLLLIALFCP